MFQRQEEEGTRCITVPDYSHFHGIPTPCVFMEIKPLSATDPVDTSTGNEAMGAIG